MSAAFNGIKAGMLAGLALAVVTTLGAQSTAPASPSGTQTPSSAPPNQPDAQSTPSAPASPSTTSPANTPAAQPAPGTTPVAGDTPPTASAPADKSKDSSKKDPDAKDPAPGTTPVKGDVPAKDVDPDKVVPVGGEMIKVKPGSIEDVSAVGNRNIGGRGMGNWYSTDSEIKMGKTYADQIEKSTHFITDPEVTEYVNRIGQNIVKNSDCKVPFTIKVIDSDEINAMALPGRVLLRQFGLDSECRRRSRTGRRDGS